LDHSLSEKCLAKYRRLLPADVDISDARLERLIGQLTAVARATCSAYLQRSGSLTKSGGLNADERVEIEERAAILEFDGKLPRGRAKAIALATANSRLT